MDYLLKFIIENHLGDVASVIGLAVAMVGFGLTIYGVFRTKKAAEQAQQAAERASEEITRYDTVAALSSALTACEEIKTLNKQKVWKFLPWKYAELRKTLVSIRTANPGFSAQERVRLRDFITDLRVTEGLIEQFLAGVGSEPSTARINKTLSEHADELNELLTVVKTGRRR